MSRNNLIIFAAKHIYYGQTHFILLAGWIAIQIIRDTLGHITSQYYHVIF
jgi:hypothetical protein